MIGEKLSSESQSVEGYLKEVKMLVEREGYTGDQIYNCDESGLLWKALPTKTLSSSIEKRAEGYKLNKDHVTLHFCANASGNIVSLFFLLGDMKSLEI